MRPFAGTECWIAWRFLRSRQREGFISIVSWFSLLGIGLGVATLIIVMSVMNGFRHDLFDRILGFNGHVTITSHTGVIEKPKDVFQKIENISGIKNLSGYTEGQALISKQTGQAQGVLFRGLSLEDLESRPLFKTAFQAVNFDQYRSGKGIFVGYHLANKMRLRQGDSLTLISPKGAFTAFGTVPRLKKFKVAGVFNTGLYQVDSGVVLMNLEQGRNFLGLDDQAVLAIELRVDDPQNPQQYSRAIQQKLSLDYRVLTWEDINGALVGALKVERNVMFLILTMIILVAAFNVISGLVMMVNEKNNAIATLRSMGYSTGSIMRIFMLAGSTTGVVGTIVGTTIGLLFCDNIDQIKQLIEKLLDVELFSAEIYFLSHLPARIDPSEVTLICVMALVLSVLASIYPALKASRINPAQVLRHE